ncbi:MAG: radical SAM family heme chaperone HemW [Bacteroidetes bacterium]|nr:radical SAM family heme chaperone HemW [Bacteroidota bacterium]
MAGIYIHIPFCKQACHYCDFHFSTNQDTMEAMVEAQVQEMQLRKQYLQGQEVDTVYFGGGTPSLLPIKYLEKLLEKINLIFPGKKSEITLEANPDDLDYSVLVAWKSLGIDRLSLGVQSFQDQILQRYHRAHNSEQAKKAIKLGREAGFEKFSIDLIYGYPHQDHSLWKEDLNIALELNPGHLSAYALTIEPKTAFGSWTKKGKFLPASEEFIAQQYEYLLERCEQAGYLSYEISNFSIPGQMALHNSNYWKGIPYLGIGPSAHSFDGKSRGHNPASNPLYLKALMANKMPFEEEFLSSEERINEAIMIGLRTIWGVDTEALVKKFQVDILHEKQIELQKIADLDLIEIKGKILTLTRKGKLLADSIAAELFLDAYDTSATQP